MNKILLLFATSIIIATCRPQDEGEAFVFKKTEQGVELAEDGQPVFFYQKAPKSLNGEFICNNYLHPLYSLKGDTLTEEFPADHPHHRGIFWAWHQILIEGKSVGDGWIMKDIEQKVTGIKTATADSIAVMKMNVLWSSPLFEDGKPFISENTTISVYPLQSNIRKIDFAIALEGLVPGVEIGGSDDKKGYGGFSVRLKLPDDLTFTSSKGLVTPKTEQVKAGPWMDFSSSFGRTGKISGVTILCHPKTPNYPAPWILRASSSMQNIVFPGRQPVTLPLNEPVVLYYRLIIHQGNANSIDLNALQAAYEKTAVGKK